MKEILTDAQMKACDSYTIEQIGVPSAVLMERAAYAVSEEVIHFADKAGRPKITVICGSGNNGGDGYACARILSLKGYEAEIFEAGNLKHMTEETARQRGICQKLSIPFQDGDMPDLKDTGLIVDALFGIGLARDVSGRYADIINAVNDSDAPVIAVDIASGISANTGKVCGCAVKADATVTMQRIKPGHILYPGTLYSGKLICADIGVVVPETGSGTQAYSLERDDLPGMLPKRDPSGNKGTFGKVLIVAGSRGMAGAAYLAAKAALRSGAGMVKILTEESNRVILQQLLPEALLALWQDEDEAVSALREALSWCTVCAAGPGLSGSGAAKALVRELLSKKREVPLILDADALNNLKDEPELLRAYEGKVTITPHIVEMARLTGKDPSEIKSNPIASAGVFALENGVQCVLKDARTVTACEDGRIFINTSGNDGMAAAGSGDVLTGILAGLTACGADPSTAGALSSYVHGLAGDFAAEKLGRSFMTASDIIDGLRFVV